MQRLGKKLRSRLLHKLAPFSQVVHSRKEVKKCDEGLINNVRLVELLESWMKEEKEEILMVKAVEKYNTYQVLQKRLFVITTKAVYNILPDVSQVRRRIPHKCISSIICSQFSDEFVLHIPAEYDYHILSSSKLAFISLLKQLESDAVIEYVQLGRLRQHVRSKQEADKARAQSSPSRCAVKVCIDDFMLLKVLGRGSFGKVMLVQNKQSERLFALKILKKACIVKRNQIEHTKDERDILVRLQHPFLMKLHFAFQSDTKLYFVMDYLKGGELFHHLQHCKAFSLSRTKLYAAEILLGIGYLHANSIIYRDLKPENVLLDRYGHVRLTDFGLSKLFRVQKQNTENMRTDTLCGTPHYLSPEVLEGGGHGREVDWWCLGVLVYEMLFGTPPFYAENVDVMYRQIQTKKLKFPNSGYVDTSVGALISGLLQKKVCNRLGSKGDVEEVRKASFFKELNWDHVLHKRYIPEFIPECADEDVKYFDEEFTKEPVVDSVVPYSLLDNAKSRNRFVGFTFEE